MQYQKYMFSTGNPVKVLNSGFVICKDLPVLGASPDGKVIDLGCRDPSGLAEVKSPESKFRGTPIEACSDRNFFLELVDGKPRLKRNHHYYAQVQGQLGVTQYKWCDFIVYTSEGMSIERIPYDHEDWTSMKNKLKSHYFDHFKVHMKPNLFSHSYKIYSLKYMIPKFEMSRIKIGEFRSAESWAVLPRKMAFKSRSQNTT